MTWPETKADLGERRNSSVEPSASSAPAPTYTRLEVLPLPPTSLPAERTKPSRARCAMAAVSVVGLVGQGADHDEAARAREAAQGRREELLHVGEAGGVGDAGGVEDQRLVALAVSAYADRGDAAGLERGVELLAERAALGGADEDGSLDQRIAFLPALQHRRVGETQVLDDELADRVVRERLVTVGHGLGVSYLSDTVGIWNAV